MNMEWSSLLRRNSQPAETRRSFGILFIAVSIAIVLGTAFSELVTRYNVPVYDYVIIWLVSFGLTFGTIYRKFRRVIISVRLRMKNSLKWPITAKIVNGICWAAPFASIAAFPSLYQYLVLTGIGLGNFSTFLLMKKYSGFESREQAIVGLLCIAFIPVTVGVSSTTLLALNHNVVTLLSRIFIALSYAVGGIYAIRVRESS